LQHSQAPAYSRPNVQGREIEITRLDNGIRVVTERLGYVRSASVGIWIGTGSRIESKSENGISHFLEHMLFKGTERRSAEQIAMEMDSLGGHMDAYTTKELVNYGTKVLDERLPEAFDVLADLVLNPVFRDEDIEKEKGVILEELKMEFDNPEYLVHDLFVRNFWGDHPLGWPIIGNQGTIQSFERNGLRDYWQMVYSPENLLITAAGNIEHTQVVDLAAQHFASLKTTKFQPQMSAPQGHSFLKLQNKDSLEQMHVLLGMPTVSLVDPRRFATYILSTVLGGGMSSRLFQKIREQRGLAYAVFSELNLYRDSGAFQFYAGCAPETAREVVMLIMEEIRAVKEHGITAEELRRAKDNLKGGTALSMEGSSSRMNNLARQALFHDRFFSIEDMLTQIENVTLAEVQQVATDCFRTERVGLAMLGRTDGIKIEAADLVC
jgi:predicted Zn-dependent peptidase